MNYEDIIENNRHNCNPTWWPAYAYHLTDLSNAVSILVSGKLLSRVKASEGGLMINDNASQQVINMTNAETKSFVRFYFRPLTPTQYYNEGFKHERLRYDDDKNANIPVPVFFFMDLKNLLSEPETCFSETAQAGAGAERFYGPEQFCSLNFGRIYGNGALEKEDVAYRHAEILYPGEYHIEKSFRGIACRTAVERVTLLNCLRDASYETYIKYRDKIRVMKEDLFYCNGLYITECDFHDSAIAIQLSDSWQKHQYMEKMKTQNNVNEMKPINATILFGFYRMGKMTNNILKRVAIDYEKTKTVTVQKLPLENADKLLIKVYFENSLMCYKQFDLSADNNMVF